ncbi:zonular occludens toxin domain-containing protein [Stenotrophomonas sp. C960]|uniref:zonular occludens toxin domain-containing protein n=1 Tax=unclassified Stenotrophomonas TaxID=196198 RepID=UPI00293C4B2D|nr:MULTISPECIES: zonular occludens toxin domain-containing protein [unclassified Stenotrophomonas]MDV3463309.1 zonular occludens toxin domain-containing protein [Stenotrophomonas sp. C960]MDV3529884.1 zonular occludens toxin domain-containing protein [Stenotrophomonas sp. C2866]
MPIELFTGQPGNGKTALMMERLVAEAKAASRPIFAAGIDGLDPGLATVLDDPRHWNNKDADGNYIVPDGSLIFVDEAWKWFGHLHDATRQQTPRHVLELAEHRHRGLDFVWTTQQPNQLYPFVRGLIGSHAHVVRRFGTKMLDVYRWGELNEEIKSLAKRDMAQRTTRLLPSQVFGQYKSAEVHTIKARIPFKVMLLPVLAVAAVVFAYLAYTSLRPSSFAGGEGKEGAQSASADAAPSPFRPGGAKEDAPRWPTAAAYAKDHLPRISTMPWTAPVFDERQARSDPQLICMSSLEGLDAQGVRQEASCRCLTEQGTAYELSQPECRTLARNGPVYNPYRERSEERSNQRVEDLERSRPGGAAASVGGVAQHVERSMGTFPESPSYRSDSYMTTAPGPNKL